MTLYEESLAMDEAIDLADRIAGEMDHLAFKLQLRIESPKQILAVKEYRKYERQYIQITQWLQQLQKIYEIIDKYKDEDVEYQDSVGAFLNILDVVDKKCAD